MQKGGLGHPSLSRSTHGVALVPFGPVRSVICVEPAPRGASALVDAIPLVNSGCC